jgi:hypothetical protein
LKNPNEKVSNTVQWKASKFFIHLLLACIIVIPFFYVIGPLYIRAFLPIFAKEIEFLHPEYTVISYDVIKIRQIDYLQFDIKVNKPMFADRPGTGGAGNVTRHKCQASTLCIAPVIVLSLILSWPALSISYRFKTFLASIPLVVLIECLDYPMIFISNIETVYSNNVLSNAIRHIWSHILNNGGRQFMALIIFLILIAPFYLKFEKSNTKGTGSLSSKTSRNAPCPCGSRKKYKNCCLKKN